MTELFLNYLEEEPKRNSKLKQLLFCFTRPIARILDAFDLDKELQIYSRRKAIANQNKRDYIEAVADVLYCEVLALGYVKDHLLCKMLCIEEARHIFNDKKQSGGFDDLNIMI